MVPTRPLRPCRSCRLDEPVFGLGKITLRAPGTASSDSTGNAGLAREGRAVEYILRGAGALDADLGAAALGKGALDAAADAGASRDGRGEAEHDGDDAVEGGGLHFDGRRKVVLSVWFGFGLVGADVKSADDDGGGGMISRRRWWECVFVFIVFLEGKSRLERRGPHGAE